MEPAFERVSVDKLNVGDKVLSSDLLAIVAWSPDAAEHVKAWPQHYRQPKLRELPPERNPDVLRRAVEMATQHQAVENAKSAEWFIDQARRELESDARDVHG